MIETSAMTMSDIWGNESDFFKKIKIKIRIQLLYIKI